MSKAPGGDEAIAVAAAIAQFQVDTAPAAAEEAVTVSPWQRAALVEGVGAKSLAQGLRNRGGEKWLS
jgi:hypothetical protein